MKKITLVVLISSLVSISVVTGCGGGGGAGGSTPPPATPTKAVVKISTIGSPSAMPLIGVQATLHLPAGVTVKASANAPQTDTNVVVASGNSVPADLVFGVYSSGSGTVNAYVAKAAGFASGEFATVNCDIAAGTSPTASAFSVSDLIVSDALGKLITGLSPSLSVTLQ